MKSDATPKLFACLAVAFIGYALAFAGATGALFAALLSVGVAGELGFWAQVLRLPREPRRTAGRNRV